MEEVHKWTSVNGNYPDYGKLIPTEFNTFAHFDTVEAIKATNSLKALSDSKAYPIDLTIGDGKVVMANPDEKGEATIPADTDGQGSVRLDGRYLAEALKACGGMVDFKLVNAYSPMLFVNDGYQVLVMPLMTPEAKAASEQARQAEAPAEASAEAEAPDKADKRKRSRKAKEPVAVA